MTNRIKNGQLSERNSCISPLDQINLHTDCGPVGHKDIGIKTFVQSANKNTVVAAKVFEKIRPAIEIHLFFQVD
jgi:hypothetical protein